MNTAVSGEIASGSLVGLRRTHEDLDAQKRLQGWIGAYGRGPFKVCQRPDQEHVSLQERGRLVHFGNVECPLIHIGYVELWQG
jgi:hypothetical protein